MKLIMGILGLLFVGLALADIGGIVMNFPSEPTANFAIGTVYKGAVALILFVFAFQKRPSGV